MSKEKREVPEPPQPPEIGRNFRVTPLQGVGLAAIFLVPVLALFGVFGESWGETAGRSAELEMRIEYATRFRYKQINFMKVWVTNATPRTMDTVTVSFDNQYLDEFSNVSFTPSASQAYAVDLKAVRPGERRLVYVHLQGEQYGSHSGTVSATAGGPDTAKARVSTFIFP